MIRNLLLVACAATLLPGKSLPAKLAESRSSNHSNGRTPLNSVPKREIYQVFFLQVVKLDEIASGLESQGKPQDARELRSYFASASGLSMRENEDLLALAHECEDALAKEDVASENHIQATRSLQSRGRAASANDWNDNAREALGLIESRKNVIDSHMSLLASKLGPTTFAKLDSYVMKQFTRALTVTALSCKEKGL